VFKNSLGQIFRVSNIESAGRFAAEGARKRALRFGAALVSECHSLRYRMRSGSTIPKLML